MSLKRASGVGLLCVLPLVAARAGDIDPALWRGLDIHADPVPGKLWFNDIPVQAVRLTGGGVDALLQRWREARAGQPMQQADVGGWRIHTVLDGTRSEVLQVRKNPGEQVAIWSVMSLGGVVHAQSPALWSLPAECRAGPEVRGMDGGEGFRQRTATCRGVVSKVLDRAQTEARRSKLLVTRQWAHGFEAVSTSLQVEVLVTVVDADGETRLVTVERKHSGEGRP